ncbi:MAG: glycosyltransferase [Prevotella sp.]|nr:glycosyltransferase [Prevotella sp.]
MNIKQVYMKVAYILNATVVNGGATKAFVNLIDGLAAYGVQPHVVVPDNDGISQVLQRRGTPVLCLTYRPCAYPRHYSWQEKLLFLPRLAARLLANRQATNRLADYLRTNQIDIVHSNTSVVRIGYDAARRTHTPHIYHIREFADQVGYSYIFGQKAFRRQLPLTHSICITKAVLHYYELEKQAEAGKVCVIYDGVFQAQPVMPMGTAKDYFLFAGRLQNEKGLDQLLKAYAAYAKDTPAPLPLKLAGTGNEDYINKVCAFIADNGLTQLVEVLGERNDISDLMRGARALVVSSRFEGFGFSMPEAMQQGCLVIARNTSGTKEQLDNGLEMTGEEIALRYENTEQLTALLTQVTRQPVGYYAPYTERAFKVVNQLYAQETNAQKVFEFYKSIAGNA